MFVFVFPLAQAFTPGLQKWRLFLSPIYGAFADTFGKDTATAIVASLLKGGLWINRLKFPRRKRLG